MSQNEPNETTSGSTELVGGVLARAKQSRAKIAKDLFPTLPPEVIEIVNCEVAYYFHPRVLPFRNISFHTLFSALRSEYDLHFKLPDLDDLAPLLQGKPTTLSAAEIGEMLISRPDPMFAFEDGLYRMPDGRAIAIQNLSFARERVSASVIGPTQAAEQLICEIVPLLWALAGVRKEWDEIKMSHQVVQYGTGTKIRLPSGGRTILSRPFLELLDKWACSGGLALQMGARSHTSNWMPPSDAKVSYGIDEVHLLFQRMTPTGLPETSRLRLSVTAKHERGTGIFLVGSELPFSEHLELVASLVKVGQD